MNYIREIRAFHDAQQTRRVDANAKLLWHELMYICNTAGWPEWFDVWSSTLEEHTGLKRGPLSRARATLVKLGYIEVKSNGTKATSFKLISQVRCYDETRNEQEVIQEPIQEPIQEIAQEPIQDVIQEAEQEAIQIPKLNKTKEDNINNTIPPYNPPAKEPKKKKTAKKAKKATRETRDVFAEYAGGDLKLLQTLRDYEAHRDGMNASFSTDRARELACRKLDELSGGDSATKIAIIEQSIMRGWQGLFELKGDRRPSAPAEEKKTEKTSRYDYAAARRKERERLKASLANEEDL